MILYPPEKYSFLAARGHRLMRSDTPQRRVLAQTAKTHQRAFKSKGNFITKVNDWFIELCVYCISVMREHMMTGQNVRCKMFI